MVAIEDEIRPLLSALPPQHRWWGGECVEVERPPRFQLKHLEGWQVGVFPLTRFIEKQLPAEQLVKGLLFVDCSGPAWSAYVRWAERCLDTDLFHAFESGIISMLNCLSFWALLLATEGDRLKKMAPVDARGAVRLLRSGARDLISSQGFLAVSVGDQAESGRFGDSISRPS